MWFNEVRIYSYTPGLYNWFVAIIEAAYVNLAATDMVRQDQTPGLPMPFTLRDRVIRSHGVEYMFVG